MLRKSHKSLAGSIVLAALLDASVLFAQTKVQGTISNGTSDRPVANQEVRLLMPRGGMQQVAAATSDGSGHFGFDTADLDPKSFYLVSADYQSVSYNAPASFDSNGDANVKLTVYDSTHSPSAVRIPAMRVLVGAEGQELRVQEEYAIQNSSDPPRAYVASSGTFKFRIPADSGTPSVSITGLMNMALPQTALAGKTPGEFSIEYPLKPGVTMLTLQYTRPYNPAGMEIQDGASYPIDQAELYVYPSSLSVSATGFQPVGNDSAHKIQKYAAPQFRGNTRAVSVRLSGESAGGPPPGIDQGSQGQEQAAQDQVKVVPNSISEVSGPILAGFLLLLFWALGVRVMKDWPRLKAQAAGDGGLQPLDAKVEKLLASIADLDELFTTGKITEPRYWKERLELKARLMAVLKKNPPATPESYAARPRSR